MASISRSQLQKQLVPGLNALFGLEYARYEEQHKEIFDVESSDRAWEEEQKISGFGAAQVKDEGSGIAMDTAQEVYTARYTHETVALGFTITEEAIEDQLYAPLAARYTKALARAMAYTKQVKAAAVLNNAFNAAVKYGDNQALCSPTHPVLSGGNNANMFATAADLNETSLEAAVIQMATWTDERGLLIAAKPRKLIVPPALQFTVSRLLNTDKRVGTIDNDINALRNNGAIPEGSTVNNFLLDSDAWFVKTDVPDGLKHFVRSPMTNKMDTDFTTGNLMYKTRERYSFGVSDPLGIFGTAGA
jgi:phage major head subunit gpT-like protein